MYINEFTDKLVLPNYRTTNYDINLQTKLLMHKQQQYDAAFQRLQSLKGSALNISMINKAGQDKLDNYNKEISDKLSGDLGDLTDSKVQANLVGVFSKIANDTDLKQRSNLSNWYLNEQSKVDRMKSDKDPAKSGYNAINESVFKNWEGGFNDFVLAENIDKFSTKRTGYTPFKDINQKLVNLTKLLHEEEKTTMGADGRGRLATHSDKGVSAERIRSLMAASLTQDELAQFDVMAKHRILTNSSELADEQLFNNFKHYSDTELRNIQSELKRTDAQLDIYNPTKLSKSDKDYNNKLQQFTERTNTLAAYKDQLKQKETQLRAESPDLKGWKTMTPDEKASNVTKMTFENYVNRVSEALAWKKETDKLESDQAYWNAQKLNQTAEMFKWRAEMEGKKFQFEQQTWAAEFEQKDRQFYAKEANDLRAESPNVGDSQGGSQRSTGFLYKDPTAVLESYDNMYNLALASGNKVSNIVETANDQDLKDGNWLQKNAENFQVKLWSLYSNTSQNPTKEGFDVWKQTRVEMGDKAAIGLMDLMSQEQAKAEVLTNIIRGADKFINAGEDVYSKKFGKYSLNDFSVFQNGKRLFRVETKNGEELIDEKTFKSYLDKETAGANAPFGSIAPESLYVIKDRNKVIAYRQFKDYEETNIKPRKKLWNQTITDKFQNVQYQFSNEDGKENETDRAVVKNVLPNINQTLRESNLTISQNQINTLMLPAQIGSRGAFTLKPAEIKRLKELNSDVVVETDSGKKSVSSLTQDDKILFDYSPTNSFDAVLDMGFKLNGQVSLTHRGQEIKLIKDKTGYKDVLLINGEQSTFQPGVSTTEVIKMAKKSIDLKLDNTK